MKFYEEGGIHHLELTRRNLEGLLAKLDDPDSARTLGKTGEDLESYVFVTAVENDEHYSNRPAGAMYTNGREH